MPGREIGSTDPIGRSIGRHRSPVGIWSRARRLVHFSVDLDLPQAGEICFEPHWAQRLLEQPAPSPLQVTMFFNGILEGAGHGSLQVSAIHLGRGRLTVHFPDSLSGDAVTTGMGGRGASPITTGGSGRSRSGIRLRAENTSFS